MPSLSRCYEQRFGLRPTSEEDLGPLPDALHRLLARRSVRRYKPDPVPESLLTALLACAQSGPTKSNLQQYSILVLRDPAKRARLAELIPSATWAAQAPVFLVFLGDLRRGRRIAELRGYPYRNDNLDSFMNAAVDAAIAMQSLILPAEAAGLGCCPISVVRNRLDDLGDLLELPDGVFPVAGLSLGWPAEEPNLSLRLPPALVVHEDRYDDAQLEAELAAYDERVFARAPIPPEKQRHVDRYGVSERGTWSENLARQLSLPERPAFRAWLARHGIAAE
jgi:nitroreductase/FMN reductase [NAD(P)H]